MPNGTYGGVRGKETKIGQKIFVSRPTRLSLFRVLLFLLLSDKNRIIPKSAIDEADIATFTTKIGTNEREI